jgi:hypothetical protein
MIFDKRCLQKIILSLLFLISPALQAKSETPSQTLSDQEIVDAYVYYLGRLLVLRQEQNDFNKEGFKWNQLIHRDVGNAQGANPNLDVAASEAWIAIDKKNCTLVEVPKITGRYYTVQVLNGWGETTANINERNFPAHPNGRFALCLNETKTKLPDGTERINLPNEKSRVVVRIELGKNPKEAIRLQKQLKLYSTGKPKVSASPKIANFRNSQLPTAEAFANAQEVLTSGPDISEGMATLQAETMAISRAIADPAQKAHINEVILAKAIPEFHQILSRLGKAENGWRRPETIGNYDSDYKTRTAVNFEGLWANNNSEVVYFNTNVDSTGAKLDGTEHYTVTFPKSALPQDLVHYFWSVTVVDAENFRVIPNLLKRYHLNNQSPLKYNRDGSLTLAFSNRLPINEHESNWVPTPLGENYLLTFRCYGPSPAVHSGKYFPPPLVKQTNAISQNTLK